jgi:uncharacterized membrane protein YeaQ/YmgE (transglycosylase-associated protein family)
MREPTLRTRVLGHPVVVLPAFGFFLFSGYTALREPGTWPMAIAATAILAPIMQAHEQRDVYGSWKRAWDGMAGHSPSPRRRIIGPLTGIVALVVVALYMVATLDRMETQGALALMVVAAIGSTILIVARKIWRRRKQVRAIRMPIVGLCIRGPLLPVPTLQQAYRALPAHCWDVLGRG